MSKIMSDGKKNAHPQGSVTGPKGVLDPDKGMKSMPSAGFNKSARSKRRPAILPKK